MSDLPPPETAEGEPQADAVELKPARIQIWPAIFAVCGLLFAAGLIWGIATALQDDGTLVPVTGRVTMEGNPVDNGFVMAAHDRSGALALASIDSQGKFELATNGVAGARIGTYRVVVKATTRSMPPEATVRSNYTDVSTTPLRMKVERGGVNHFEFTVEPP